MTVINRPKACAMDLGSYDALVIGGGLSGWAAAVSLARAGREVLLAAHRTGLGHEVWSALSLWASDPSAAALAQQLLEHVGGEARYWDETGDTYVAAGWKGVRIGPRGAQQCVHGLARSRVP